VTADSGKGGDGDSGGGAGGGGYGGGGGGDTGGGDADPGTGGGGGGSFAAQSSLPFTADPGGEAADGWISFVFNATNIPAFTPRGLIGGTNNGDSCWLPQTLTVLAIGDYTLLWQTDGNLVLYDGALTQPNAVWASFPTNPDGQALCWQGDGNLVIYNADGSPLWASDTADTQHGGAGGQWLTLYQDGTLEIVNGSGVVLWTAS